MRRAPGVADIAALIHVMRRIGATHADVVHGHGAKGGAYARLACNARRAIRVYTPHGGSLHFDRGTLAGRLYLGVERLLMSRSDLIVFESGYSAEVFRQKVGNPLGLARIVHNGVTAAEFEPVAVAAGGDRSPVHRRAAPSQGRRRADRGHRPPARPRPPGDGDHRRRRRRARRNSSGRPTVSASRGAVRFPGAMPARQAFALGRVLVVPSRAESLPYVVLEAGAAGKPLIATRVGGIAEILGPDAGRLVPPNDAGALAEAILRSLDRPDETAAAAAALRARIAQGFSVDSMVDGVLAAYAEAIAARGRR